MLKNYFITAIRNLVRHKLYSFINIGGLTVGLAACLMIFLFVQNELAFDKMIPDGERIVRLETNDGINDTPNSRMAVSAGAIRNPLAASFPDMIEASTRMYTEWYFIRFEELKFSEQIWRVDSEFFDVFNLEIVAGNKNAVFNDYQSVVITETVAKKYFGEQTAVGQTLEFSGKDEPMKIVAVMKDLPENTHLELGFLLQLNEAHYEKKPWVTQWWGAPNLYTYFKLKSAEQISTLAAALPAWFDANAVPGQVIKADQAPSESMGFNLVSVYDIHLYSTGKFQVKPSGDILVVYSFTTIAVLILIIAIINFTNLSTARASLRAKEIALRKVVGASRRQLIGQFLGEAMVTTLIALVLAFAIVELGLPWIADFVGADLSFSHFSDPTTLAGLAAVAVVIGLSAGAYPSLKLSSFRPAHVLHTNAAAKAGSVKLRAALTMLQFTIAIGLMITTSVIYSQIQFAKTIESGFDKTNKLALYNLTFGEVKAVATTIQQEIQNLPGVKATSFSNRPLPLEGFWSWPIRRPGYQTNRKLNIEPVDVDFDYLELYGAELVAGRLFSKDKRGDLPVSATPEGDNRRETIIINETAVKHLGFESAEDAVGQMVQTQLSNGGYNDVHIIGVVKDMYLRSLRENVDANMFSLEEGPNHVLNIHMDPARQQSTMREIETIWNRHAPPALFEQHIVTDEFDAFYVPDQRRVQMFAGFSIFAILVSCLGLYGLASFTAEQRIKEIGVRKVLGARVRDIVALLTFQFSKPVLLANLIAWPVAWFVADSWLSGFIYRIELSAVYFFTAGALTLAIASLTVASHAYKTARANPIAALKNE